MLLLRRAFSTLPVLDRRSQLLESINSAISLDGVSLMFAYGSGIMPQHGSTQAEVHSNMIDLVIAVDDPCDWHRENKTRNRHHYSTIFRRLPPKRLAYFQDYYAAHIFCNTLVQLNPNLMVKYSVISTDRLIADCLDWESLYISGRLHKPVSYLIGPEPSSSIGPGHDLANVLNVNLSSAFHAACLLSSEQLSLEDFFIKLCSLSYDGDFRIYFGEDRRKISKIVKGSYQELLQLYKPFFADQNGWITLSGDSLTDIVYQDLSPGVIYHHLEMLPRCVQWNLQSLWNLQQRRNQDTQEVIFDLARNPTFDIFVKKAIRRLVFRSSVTQSFKNILSAGVRKTFRYSARKISKMIRSII